MTTQDRSPSIPDDVLVRYLDGVADPAERAGVDAAANDGATQARLAELRSASALFHDAASDLTAPPLPRLRRPRLFRPARAAAVALLLAGSAAAAMPSTRSTLLDGLGAVWSWASGNARSASPSEPSREGLASIGVPVTGPDFLMEFEGDWTDGTLHISRSDDDDVRVTAGQAELLVLPGGVRVRPGPGTSKDVTVSLPTTLQRLRVIVAGVTQVVDLLDPRAPASVPLGPPGG